MQNVFADLVRSCRKIVLSPEIDSAMDSVDYPASPPVNSRIGFNHQPVMAGLNCRKVALLSSNDKRVTNRTFHGSAINLSEYLGNALDLIRVSHGFDSHSIAESEFQTKKPADRWCQHSAE
jgi:hypothetical protein